MNAQSITFINQGYWFARELEKYFMMPGSKKFYCQVR